MTQVGEEPPSPELEARGVTEPGSTPLTRTGGRCVLVFHRIVTGVAERDHDVTSEDFITLLDRLQAAGCTFAADLAAEPRDGAVVLTFDDGTYDHLAVGAELARRGVPAVFFISAGILGASNHLEGSDLHELVAGGHAIGSHGWSHRRLDQVSPADLVQEIETSRATLQDVTGLPITLFAPAGGIEGPDLPARLRAAGYLASRSTRWGIHRRMDDLWRIPTVPVTHVTVDRRWVDFAAREGRMPPAMVAVGAVRKALRPGLRTVLRGRFHGPDAGNGTNGHSPD
jgi:peptidoglycan/xylan/chitin deacetylase (PgdA/CDA1 family)